MSDTTPITQEEKQAPSLVDHLRHLLADVTAQHTSALHQVQGWKERRRKSPSELNGAQVATWEGTIKWTAEKAEALVQTIAILSVLTHPDFYQLEDFGRLVDLCNGGRAYVSLQRVPNGGKRSFVGETVLDALLKAHAALKPQDGATSGKESTDV